MLHFEADLTELRERLLTMASHAAAAVRNAIRSVVERDDELARQVEADDTVLDNFEKEVDEISLQLLARAPLARDLRFIVVAAKLSHDLERIGDEATAIARRAQELSREPQLKPYLDVNRMSRQVLEMINDAIGSFVALDGAKARSVVARDREVDELNRQLHRELTSFIAEAPSNISRCLNLMQVAKRLERIGDHATNIAEEVVYLSEARDIRHTGMKTPG